MFICLKAKSQKTYKNMKELLNYIISRIVSNPDDIQIEIEETEGGFINLRLQVHPEDMGIVIGKGGNIIRALRSVLKVKAIKENKRVNLELVETKDFEAASSEEISEEN